MEDSDLIDLFTAAWRGLARKLADPRDPDKPARARDRYLHRLRNTPGLEQLRGVLAELLADGLIGGGGPDWWHDPAGGGVAKLWRELAAEGGPARVRDLALVSAAGAGAKS